MSLESSRLFRSKNVFQKRINFIVFEISIDKSYVRSKCFHFWREPNPHFVLAFPNKCILFWAFLRDFSLFSTLLPWCLKVLPCEQIQQSQKLSIFSIQIFRDEFLVFQSKEPAMQIAENSLYLETFLVSCTRMFRKRLRDILTKPLENVLYTKDTDKFRCLPLHLKVSEIFLSRTFENFLVNLRVA